ncbi:hypothetical protein TRFO_22409 [Tritrichomonas foetus]|uniref:Transmembrane protein n=1 Tax=Tritrichomonas foetus TaxID=1144522 RepID=A0A1J4KGZ0_9EUKA|nr:hypothetical protein TRFO_22409 [Tritrichomonas foetus]|eukprot:OHT08910.1 hypothetical protein TRFO_22409 [Tritrichomonas foetus]
MVSILFSISIIGKALNLFSHHAHLRILLIIVASHSVDHLMLHLNIVTLVIFLVKMMVAASVKHKAAVSILQVEMLKFHIVNFQMFIQSQMVVPFILILKQLKSNIVNSIIVQLVVKMAMVVLFIMINVINRHMKLLKIVVLQIVNLHIVVEHYLLNVEIMRNPNC